MFRFTVTVVAMSLLQFGCSSVQRVDKTPEDLQAQIRAGKYLHEGEDVTIVTNQGKELFFRSELNSSASKHRCPSPMSWGSRRIG